MLQLLVIGNAVSNSPILVTLMMETILSSGTSVLTRAKRETFQKSAFFSFTSVLTYSLAEEVQKYKI
jgi:hypothetical protein